ncbi:MAG: hypothetical protein PHI55_12110 [Burkholderiaceae bacterium]|nr:hypothetical protein [Burkholderiaceae bacterium]
MEFKSLRNTLTVVLAAGGWVACGGDLDGGAETAKVSLLAFSDLYGRLENGGNGLLLDAANPNGTRASLGGVAYRGTLIARSGSLTTPQAPS